MEISLSSNSITDDHIATKFGTCHDSLAVVPCAKYCSDHFISIWMGAKWNFHHIWIVMEKLLVKWAPVPEGRGSPLLGLWTDGLFGDKSALVQPNSCQAITWTNDDPVRWRTYPADTLRKNDVIITLKRCHFDAIASKWRRFDVITRFFYYYVMRSMGIAVTMTQRVKFVTRITLPKRKCEITVPWYAFFWTWDPFHRVQFQYRDRSIVRLDYGQRSFKIPEMFIPVWG